MAKRQTDIVIKSEVALNRLCVWSELMIEEIESIDGITHAVENYGAEIFAYLDPRFDPCDVANGIRALAEKPTAPPVIP